MAPPSPRRSSRARPPNTQLHQSSTNSSTSGRVPRNLNKPSSAKSTSGASLSSESPEATDDTLLGRRRKRGQEDDHDKASQPDNSDMNNASDDLQDEEDEAVRCLCESEDYPGCPPLEGPDSDFFASIEFTEDVTGFFVQCDICKVWQHGACVGIFSAESSPDEYFCEQCRKDLHRIHTGSNGQKYSKYVPLHRTSRAHSRATSTTKDGAESPKPGTKNLRPGSSHNSGKRRSTMNSRDAAYDDEQLLKAIEASREETATEPTENTTRRTKRGRSNSEEDSNAPAVKRQRTNSQSTTPPPERPESPINEQSDDETRQKSTSKTKSRTSRHNRERSEKEDKERQRQEAANKRKGRAERRRAEDSDPSDDIPLAAVTKSKAKANEEPPTSIDTPPAPPPVPDTPPTSAPQPVSSHKRGARSHHKKGKGKNQYTKDREADREDSPAQSTSRDSHKNADEAGQNKTSGSEPKNGPKSKITMASRMSILDMKRRVAAIMDFISRTQIDLAAEGSIGSTNNSTPTAASVQNGAISQINGNPGIDTDGERVNGILGSHQEFKGLSCIEMMDVLTRDMMKWQNQYT